MRSIILFVFTCIIFFFSSCSKTLDDRIPGNWQLSRSWKQGLFDRDYFQTGYENGVFTFMDNGNATYTSATDTLTGYWRTGRYVNNYYNSGSGRWEDASMKYLEIYLVNFQQNKLLNWRFDDFHFRDTWHEIRAEQYSVGRDRVYEFDRK